VELTKILPTVALVLLSGCNDGEKKAPPSDAELVPLIQNELAAAASAKSYQDATGSDFLEAKNTIGRSFVVYMLLRPETERPTDDEKDRAQNLLITEAWSRKACTPEFISIKAQYSISFLTIQQKMSHGKTGSVAICN